MTAWLIPGSKHMSIITQQYRILGGSIYTPSEF